MARGDAPFSAKKSAKKKPRGKPFQPGNPYRVKPGTILNPTGRPKRLSESYAHWLRLEDDKGVSNSDKVAEVVGKQSLDGNDKAYKEMRQATEGDKVFNLDPSTLTDEQLDRLINGEHPANVVASTGNGGEGEAPSTGQDSQGADTSTPALDSPTSND